MVTNRLSLILVVGCALVVSTHTLASSSNAASTAYYLTNGVKTYKVTLSKSDQGSNRTVYIQAKDSSEARQTAKDQNPGWQVEEVDEVK